MFVWNEEGGSFNETLENRMESLKYSISWNHWGRFLVVATESSNEPAHLLALHLCSILWQVARIVNLVVLITNDFANRPLHAMSTTKRSRGYRLNLYTWFPFKLGGCGNLQVVILLDEWLFGNNVRFSENAHLYSAKIPKYLMSCHLNWLPQELIAVWLWHKITKEWCQYYVKSNRIIGWVI